MDERVRAAQESHNRILSMLADAPVRPLNKATARGSVLRMMLADMRKQPALTVMFPSLVTLFADGASTDRERWRLILKGIKEIAT